MDPCPHCGEPVAPHAEACPHCGSDFETGWNPDAEYYSVELPEFDDDDVLEVGESRKEPAPVNIEPIVGSVLVAVSALGFVFITRAVENPTGMLAVVLLCASYFVYSTQVRSQSRERFR